MIDTVKARMPVALGAALMAALLAGCQETTPVRDVVSRTFTLKAADFAVKLDPDGRNAVASATYDMAQITPEIVAAGTVTADLDLRSNGAEWSALPLTLRFTDPVGDPHTVAIQSRYRKGQLTVLLRAVHQSALAGVLEVDGYKLRVVAIRGQAAEG